MTHKRFGKIKRLTIAEMRIRDGFLSKFLNFIPRRIKPNYITACRVLLSGALFFPETVGPKMAFFILMIGALGDPIDGILARNRNQITGFGKIFDALADKILAVGALWYLFYHKIIESKLVLHVVLPEIPLLFYGAWFLFDRKIKIPQSNILGRIKFASYVLGFLALIASSFGGHSFFLHGFGVRMIMAGIVFAWMSQIFYAHDFIEDMRERKKNNLSKIIK